ncbi:MAG: superoxide dismutase family protein [Clostridia bacterium]|nr:superoxide dismutase family protein [Clostridia bacterium]
MHTEMPGAAMASLREDCPSDRSPAAIARVYGSTEYPGIRGTVRFFPAPGGSIVETNVEGLPAMSLPTATPQVGPFAYHIHEGASCGNNAGPNAFEAAGGHFNPTGQPHPLEAGDMPVLFSNGGLSYSRVYTSRFRPADVVGRTVIIHQSPDDYRTPTGGAGMRIACGPVERY